MFRFYFSKIDLKSEKKVTGEYDPIKLKTKWNDEFRHFKLESLGTKSISKPILSCPSLRWD